MAHQRLFAVAGLLIVTLLAWAYTLAGSGMGMSAARMTAMTPWPGQPSMSMPLPVWSLGYALLMLAMWWVMMVAMMLPSAAPMILLYDRVQRRASPARHFTGTLVFTCAYLLAWLGFSVIAVALQWWLTESGWLSPMLTLQPAWLAAAVFIAAGVYQLTPLKNRCLSQCRAPSGFVATRWRAGVGGAWRMGLEHGAICLVCCWGLMALLFVGGIMNLYWIAGLALLVLAEKALPGGRWIGYASGLVLIGWGLLLL